MVAFILLGLSTVNMLIGHKRAQEFFSNAIASGRLSHSYLLVGSEHIGKRALAENVIAKLIGIEPEKLKTSTDFILIEQDTDEKTGNLKKDISIEQIINLRSRLSLHSFSGGYTGTIIDRAEHLNVKSANALLKTLEEPKEKTVIFLTVADEDELPQTILSRCQTIYLSPVKEIEIAEGLRARGAVDAVAAELARVSRGLPGLALRWMQDNIIYEEYKAEIQRFTSLWGKPFYQKLKAVESVFGPKGDGEKVDHVAARERLHGILDLWELQLRDIIVSGKANMPVDTLLAVRQEIKQAKELVLENVHPRLLVEQVLLAIS